MNDDTKQVADIIRDGFSARMRESRWSDKAVVSEFPHAAAAVRAALRQGARNALIALADAIEKETDHPKPHGRWMQSATSHEIRAYTAKQHPIAAPQRLPLPTRPLATVVADALLSLGARADMGTTQGVVLHEELNRLSAEAQRIAEDA